VLAARRDPHLPARRGRRVRHHPVGRLGPGGDRLRVGRRGLPVDGARPRLGRQPERVRGRRARAGHRAAQPARHAPGGGPRRVHRPRVPLGALGPRLRPARQAGRGDRHRGERRAVRPGGGPRGREADPVPALAELVPAPPQPGVRCCGGYPPCSGSAGGCCTGTWSS
jgi:hypothetical protein